MKLCFETGDQVVNKVAPENWGYGTVKNVRGDNVEVEWFDGVAAVHSHDDLAPRTFHLSDCALHNEPAYPVGPCDCGAMPPTKGLDVDGVMEIVTEWVDREMDNMPTSGLTSVRDSQNFHEAMMPLRKALEDLAGKADPWISVEDRLPEPKTLVLTWAWKSGYSVEWMVSDAGWDLDPPPTYWMPIPAPPDK